MKIESHLLGTLIETEAFQILMGNKESHFQSLQTHFPAVRFKRIKQVHGDRTVHTSPHSIDFSNEADAHYTNESKLGLCISTADCIPVFFYHSEPQWVCGIHAGWRGVENRIFPKSIASLKRLGCKPDQLKVFIGPHIQRPSFEVGNDVRDRLLASCANDGENLWEAVDESKSKVDLHQILKIQLVEAGISLENSYFELKNTGTDLQYHSFRRDKENSGRQLSFISLK